jgi:transcriptional regulator with XRE-family HTH domain
MKRFRQVEGLSQMLLAERVDSSTNYISEIEMGRKFPSVEMIERLACALNVDPYQLFKSDDSEAEQTRSSGDYLRDIPVKIRKDLAKKLSARVTTEINESFMLE